MVCSIKSVQTNAHKIHKIFDILCAGQLTREFKQIPRSTARNDSIIGEFLKDFARTNFLL